MNRWSFFAVLVLVAGAVGAFAIYTFGFRDTGSLGLGRAEKGRVASIVGRALGPNSSFYIDEIQRTSPNHYLVRFRNYGHPSVRPCVIYHVDFARKRLISHVQAPCD